MEVKSTLELWGIESCIFRDGFDFESRFINLIVLICAISLNLFNDWNFYSSISSGSFARVTPGTMSVMM